MNSWNLALHPQQNKQTKKSFKKCPGKKNTRAERIEIKMASGPICLREGGEFSPGLSTWKPVGFLAWVSSSQRPKLVEFNEFNVPSCADSAPPSSRVQDDPAGCSDGRGKKNKNKAKLKSVQGEKKVKRISSAASKLGEEKKHLLFQARKTPIQPKERCSVPGPRCAEHTGEGEIEQSPLPVFPGSGLAPWLILKIPQTFLGTKQMFRE